MVKMELLDLIKELRARAEIISNKNARRRIISKLEEIKNIYEQIVIPDDLKNVYDSLIKKGNKLLKLYKKGGNNDIIDQTNYYIRYLKAASFDFQGESFKIKYYIRLFLIMAILFFALSPQYFGFILPIIFLIPAYTALKGIKRRSRDGFRISLAFVPVSIMAGATWVRYFIYALRSYDKVVENTARDINTTLAVAKLFVIVPGLLGIILIFAALMEAILGYKYRDYFV